MPRRLRVVFTVSALVLFSVLGAAGWHFHAALRREQATVTLVTAVKKHDTQAAITALNAGADSNVRDDHDVIPKPLRYYVSRLWSAIRGRPLTSMKETGHPMLVCALEGPDKWDIQLVKALLDKGANPNLTKIDSDNRADNALMWAAENRAVNESDVNDDKARQQRSPLSRTLVALLLQHGADPNANNKYDRTPLYVAKDFATVQLLLAYGASANGCPAQPGEEPHRAPLLGWNPRGDTRIAWELLRHGADPNVVDTDDETVLMRVASMGSVEQARLFLQYGARINLKTKTGTALTYGAMRGKPEMIRFLLAQGADPNSTAIGGMTALMSAAYVGDVASVKALLRAGANVSARDTEGKTASWWAHIGDVTELPRYSKVSPILKAIGAH